MTTSIDEFKELLLKEKEKYQAEKEFKEAVKKVYSKPKNYYNRLSASVKKSAHLNSGGLDLHKDENRHYTKENTQRWLESTSYFENYTAMKEQDEWN
tara:strand:- start:3267 stop:3557 length:291 start_codon:yes stop_codon:yes gene_type:complete